MAVAIYHGAAGSYKTASAVWFQILPALRAGRCVVTNIEGMKTLDEIERNLGERFPMSAKIIRILSNNENGLFLWQNFYSWAPLGSLIVIDEAQDIYNKTVGFDLPKNKLIPIDSFSNLLPAGYLEYYYRIFNSFTCPEAFTDDTGFSTVDANGRAVLPLNYNSALMTHRHYNWDIYYLTPAINQIDASVRGVCEIAFHHKNKDSTVKRRPRVWEHDPKSTATKPDKDAVITHPKIPLDAFLLYKSTSTGKITKSGLGASLFSNWRFWMFIILLLACFSTLAYTLSDYKGLGYDATTDNDKSTQENNSSIETQQTSTSSSPTALNTDSLDKKSLVSSSPDNKANKKSVSLSSKENSGVLGGVHNFESIAQITDFLNSKTQGLSIDFNSLYLSSVQQIKKGSTKAFNYLFNYDGQYYDSDTLIMLGYSFTYVNDCLTFVSHSGTGRLLSCDRTVQAWTSNGSDSADLVDNLEVIEELPQPLPVVDLSGSAISSLVSTEENNDNKT